MAHTVMGASVLFGVTQIRTLEAVLFLLPGIP